MIEKSFRNLIVWQKAKALAIEIYKATNALPKSELFGLTSQMRRAVISISSNIAESYNRFHDGEKKQFLFIAYASGSELESQLEIAITLFPDIDFSAAEMLLSEIQRMLNKIVHSTKTRF